MSPVSQMTPSICNKDVSCNERWPRDGRISPLREINSSLGTDFSLRETLDPIVASDLLGSIFCPTDLSSELKFRKFLSEYSFPSLPVYLYTEPTQDALLPLILQDILSHPIEIKFKLCLL